MRRPGQKQICQRRAAQRFSLHHEGHAMTWSKTVAVKRFTIRPQYVCLETLRICALDISLHVDQRRPSKPLCGKFIIEQS
jgi:hypothetical protein